MPNKPALVWYDAASERIRLLLHSGVELEFSPDPSDDTLIQVIASSTAHCGVATTQYKERQRRERARPKATSLEDLGL